MVVVRTLFLCWFAELCGDVASEATTSETIVAKGIGQIDCFMSHPFSDILRPWQSMVDLGAFPSSSGALNLGLYEKVPIAERLFPS
jgi:hypothetical protein